ncbi:MAG: hypothetical protein WBB45_19455 [Cyclobacteriaceae bacterium]
MYQPKTYYAMDSLKAYRVAPAGIYGGKKDKTTQDTARTASADGGGIGSGPPIHTGEPPEGEEEETSN